MSKHFGVKLIPVWLSFLLIYSHTAYGAGIKGKIQLKPGWEPVIYLSVISSFDDLNTASYDFLIYQVEVDSMGNFEFKDIELEKDDRLYRLHLCKTGDPVSTIMIGGKEENYIHFIMNGESGITLETGNGSSVFSHAVINGHPANKELRDLFSLKKKMRSPPEVPSQQNREFRRKQVLNSLINQVKSSQNPIIRLMAAHLIGRSFDATEHIDLYSELKHSLEENGYESPYFDAYQAEFSFYQYHKNGNSKSKTDLIWLIIPLAAFLLIAVFIISRYAKRWNKQIASSADREKLLSIQEKKVYQLLRLGKSNKEISTDLNIEVSTVKSHIHNIFSKLDIRSRKELYQYQ